ncbi:hypothetical protein D3C76_172360 [compost metagenome]
MKKYIPYMIAGSLAASLMLAGCSSDTDTNSASSGAGSQAAQSRTNPGGQTGTGQNGMDRANMSFGKIKSISGSTITLYTAEMPAGRPQNAGENAGGAATGAGAKSGQAPEGQTAPPESGTPEGGGPGGEQGGNRLDGGNGMRGGGMIQNFSGETTDITVGSDTQIVSVTFDNGSQQETALSLSDLKADDIIQYTLNTDTAEAEKITLGTGNFGGRGMGGGAARSGGAQGSGAGGVQGTDAGSGGGTADTSGSSSK